MQGFQRISASMWRKLLEKYNYACAVCGAQDTRLELAHLIPLSRGGDVSEENLIALCPDCHLALDREPREIEFSSFLAELLESHPSFSDVRREALLGHQERFRADIIARRTTGDKTEELLIECKTPPNLSFGRVDLAVRQLETYSAISGITHLVLAVPATLRDCDLLALNAANIEVWDLQSIANLFAEQIPKATFGYYKVLFLSRLARPSTRSREQELLDALAVCPLENLTGAFIRV